MKYMIIKTRVMLNLKINRVCIYPILLILLFSTESYAIPAFARKYQTSCTTCHSVYPRLNSFGEAFRINGYRFPKDDEDKVKETPVTLGSEAYKRVFPKAVWPSTLPGNPSFSIRGLSSFETRSQTNLMTGEKSMISEFGRPALQLLGSAALSEKISIFAGAQLFDNGAAGSIDNFFLKFNDMFSKYIPEKLLSVRIGQFIPELVPFATYHRSLTNSPYAFNTYDPDMGSTLEAKHVHAGGAFGIEKFQLGMEVSGIVESRLRYVAGIVNGTGISEDINSNRDFYGKLAYKIGGLAFDGTQKDSSSVDNEVSFTLGCFAYKGVGTDTVMGANTDYDFNRFGGNISINYKKLNLLGGYIMGANKDEHNTKYNLFFVETSYMVYPWLVGLLRYEQANPYGEKSVSQFVPHISALLIANVRLSAETRLNTNDIGFDNLYLGIDFAF